MAFMRPAFETDRLIIRSHLMSDLQAGLSMDRDRQAMRSILDPWASE
jgi:hypothetical protein